MDKVTVGELISTMSDDDLVIVAGGASGLKKPIGQPKVQRVGIALTGFVKNVGIQSYPIDGSPEIGYLKTT